jgi:TP901 family phage tail tape measure protein
MAAANLDIKVGYNIESVQRILDDFNSILKTSDLDKVLIPDQQKVIAAIENIKSQMAAGVGIENIDFRGAFDAVETYAKKAAFVVGEEFNKELKKYSDDVIHTQEKLVKKQEEISKINQEMADLNARKSELGKVYGMKTPTSDPAKLQERIDTLKDEEEEDPLGDGGEREKRIEYYENYLALIKEIAATKPKLEEKRNKAILEQQKLEVELKKQEAIYTKELKKLGVDEATITKMLLGVRDKLNKVYGKGIDAKDKYNKKTEKQLELESKDKDSGDDSNRSFGARIAQTLSFGIVMGQLKRALRESIETIKELDKAMTDAAIVTNLNREEAWKLLGAYQNLARETGLATSEISGIVVEFLKQGRTVSEAMELAEVSAKAAKVAGIQASEAVDFLTAAVNGFNLAATAAEDIADKFSSISAASATDFEELAIAMSKVAPVAYSAGVGVDFMMGVLAKGLETTREAPENIGTAFKTIFARMREVTDIGKATEDGMSLNRVEKALASINVPLRSASGQFRNLEEVLMDVGNQWEELTSIEQAYLATALAGTRQQPRLLAIFNDFERTKELIELSSEATGQLAFQHVEYMQGAEAALAGLKTSWEGFIMAFTETELIIDGIRLLTDVINILVAIIGGSENALRNFNLFLSGIAAVYIVLNIQKLANVAATGLEILANIFLKKSTDNYEKSIKKLSKAKKSDLMSDKMSLISDAFKLIFLTKKTAGTKTYTKVLAKETLAKKANAVATWAMLGVVLLVIVAIAILTAIIVGLVMWLSKSTRSTQELEKAMVENNKELDELSSKEKDLKKLVDRFNELAKITNKSAEEMEELKNLAKELQAVEFGNQRYNLTRTDLAGNEVFDEGEYNRLLAAMELRRQELLQENLDIVKEAFGNKKIFTKYSDFADLLNSDVLMDAARKIGYDFGINFIQGQTQALDSAKNKAKAAFLKFTQDLDIDKLFLQEEFKAEYARTTTGPFSVSSADGYRKTLEDIYNYDKISGRNVTYSKEMTFDEFMQKIESNQIHIDVRTTFDEAGLKAYSEKISTTLIKTYSILETKLAEINDPDNTETAAVKMQKTIQAQIDAFKFAQDDLRRTLTGQQLTYALEMLGTTMQDEKILEMLTNPTGRYKIRVNVLATMSTDLNTQEIEDLFNEIEENIQDVMKKRVKPMTLGDFAISKGYTGQATTVQLEQMFGSSYKTYLDGLQKQAETTGTTIFNGLTGALDTSFNMLFNNTGKGITDGVQRLYTELKNRGFSLDEIKTVVKDILNDVNIATADELATKIKDQGTLTASLFKLGDDIKKGDLGKFTEMVGEFGYTQVMGILQGSETAMKKFFADQKTETMQAIDESIAGIKAIYLAQGMTEAQIASMYETDKTKAAERDQLALLEMMKETYSDIVDLQQMRNYRLEKTKTLQTEINNLLKLETMLNDLQVADTGFIAIIDKIIELKRSAAETKLGDQLKDDLENLKEFVDTTGEFKFNPNADINQANAAFEGTIETLTQLIDLQTASYKEQEKTIKDRYNEEIKALKDANAAKWEEIEYTNKLAEAEEKIINARRNLEALTISGASRGALKEAQDSLKKIREERDKIIETQMIDEAQKELELNMQAELTTALDILNNGIEGYTKTLAELIKIVNAQILNPPPPAPPAPEDDDPGTPGDGAPGDTGTGDKPTMTFEQMAVKFDTTALKLGTLGDTGGILDQTSNSLTTLNETIKVNLIDSIGSLNTTIQNWKVVNTSGSSDSGMVTE